MNLFISYSSKSREAVQQLASDLSDLGYTVWFDRELTGGHQWWAAILAQIRDCDVFVFALTPESLESFPCELEWKYARDCHKRILPVQLAEVRLASIPAGLQEIQLVDYREQGKSQQAALNRALVKLPPAKPLPDPLPAEPPTPLSPLVRFGEQIDALTLSGDEQILLVAKLRPFLDDADTKADALALLKRLRRRDDLLARTADEIGRLLDEPMRAASSVPTIPTHTAIHTFNHDYEVYCALFAHDDEILAGCENGHVYQWDTRARFVQSFVVGPPKKNEGVKLHNGAIRTMSLSPDGLALLTGSDDHRVRLWNYPELSEAGPVARVHMEHTRAVNGVAISPNGDWIVSCGDDGKIRVWSSTIGAEGDMVLDHGDKVRGVAISPDGKYIASAGTDGVIHVWGMGSGMDLRRFRGHESSVNGVAFSPDGRLVASCSSDWSVRLWNIESGAETQRFMGHNGRITSVAFAPDGKHIVSAAADKRAIIWDIERGTEMCQFVGHTERITSVAFSPDGKTIVTASHDKTARVWETGL
ncbi:MAG: TIR domain-containing protein [Anaerolineae bacterium]|nr:TIR domain-containing protein [Anaerolineae bacterium]